MLWVEVCARAFRASQNVKKRSAPCVLALPKRVSGRVLWGGEGVDFFVWRSPAGVEIDGKCAKQRNHITRGVEPVRDIYT